MSIVTLSNRGVRSVTTFGSVNAGSMVFIKKLTASSSSTLSFVNGSSSVVLDSTYKEYLFTFKDIHPATNGASLQFNMSADSGSNYNVTKTTTAFYAYHREDDGGNGLSYSTGEDIAQGTGFQNIAYAITSDNKSCGVGTLHLFNPSSTTFVKHFIARSNAYAVTPYSIEFNYGGYGNTTSAVDAIQFKMSSGNIDAGDICLYGIL